MSVRAGSVRIACRTRCRVPVPVADLPVFLCPGLIAAPRAPHPRRQLHSTPGHRAVLATSTTSELPKRIESSSQGASITKLPLQCPGCGALTQTIDSDAPGYYNLKRRSVSAYLKGEQPTSRESEEDAIVEQSLRAAAEKDPSLLSQLELFTSTHRPKTVKAPGVPFCERCHNLKHHDKGVSIHHPSVQSLEDTIFESPHKYNHVYHVIDAADFPMSLVQGIHKLLNLTPQRSLNRRSKTGRFYHGRKTEVSFIITRSDLLAPKKEQVDSMMPYLRSVLRTALGRAGNDVRLGNVRCVSAKRGWWIRELKEDIWRRGGGGWMVGKVNVGKSRLFHEVFPKGRRGDVDSGKLLTPATPLKKGETEPESTDIEEKAIASAKTDLEGPADDSTALPAEDNIVAESSMGEDLEAQESAAEAQLRTVEPLDTTSLLPPLPEETDYPEMPLVSALPGTTASPIRVPFGNGKGELIDLPGLSRGDIELHVQPEHRLSLVMRSRVRPEQKVIKPGQSLLLGGFIRITPTTPDVIFLAYSFNPLKTHVTSLEKAIGIQTQTRESTVENIALPGVGEKIASAGTFHLKWDVTKQRTGPITDRAAVGIQPERLPYRVMGADILIEGVGWVELVAQVRKRRGELARAFEEGKKEEKDEDNFEWEEKEKKEEIDPDWPTVEVFSPEGKFIATRMPMNAWSFVAQKPSENKLHGRPRRAMKGAKKAEKKRARMQVAGSA